MSEGLPIDHSTEADRVTALIPVQTEEPQVKDPRKAVLRRLRVDDAYGFLTPEARQKLDDRLRESSEAYRRGLNDALSLWVG